MPVREVKNASTKTIHSARKNDHTRTKSEAVAENNNRNPAENIDAATPLKPHSPPEAHTVGAVFRASSGITFPERGMTLDEYIKLLERMPELRPATPKPEKKPEPSFFDQFRASPVRAKVYDLFENDIQKLIAINLAKDERFENNEVIKFFGQNRRVLYSEKITLDLLTWCKQNPNHALAEGIGGNEVLLDESILKPDERFKLIDYVTLSENNSKFSRSVLFLLFRLSPEEAYEKRNELLDTVRTKTNATATHADVTVKGISIFDILERDNRAIEAKTIPIDAIKRGNYTGQAKDEKRRSYASVFYFGQNTGLFPPDCTDPQPAKRIKFCKKDPYHNYSIGHGLNEAWKNDRNLSLRARKELLNWADEFLRDELQATGENKDSFAKSLRTLFPKSEDEALQAAIDAIPPKPKKKEPCIFDDLEEAGRPEEAKNTPLTYKNKLKHIKQAQDENRKDCRSVFYFGQNTAIFGLMKERRIRTVEFCRSNPHHNFSIGFGLNEALRKPDNLPLYERKELLAWADGFLASGSSGESFAKSLRTLFPASGDAELETLIEREKHKKATCIFDNLERDGRPEEAKDICFKYVGHKENALVRAQSENRKNLRSVFYFGQNPRIFTLATHKRRRLIEFSKSNPYHNYSIGFGLNEALRDRENLPLREREELLVWADEFLASGNSGESFAKSLRTLFPQDDNTILRNRNLTDLVS